MGLFQELIAYFIPKEEARFPKLPFIDLADLRILSAPNPEDFYPAYSKHAGEFGSARLLLQVDQTGKVAQIKLVKSSGYARLDQAASQLSEQFVFKTYLIEGQACVFQTSIEVEFKKA